MAMVIKRATRHLKHVLFGLVALFSLSSSASAWWNDEWTQRKALTVDAGAAGAETALPVLVRLHVGNFDFGAARDDGADLRFIAEDDRTSLAYHVEKYDSLLGEAFVWVSVTAPKPGAPARLWLYYGNKQVGSTGDAAGTYDAETVAVYHFGEAGQPARDHSRAANTAETAGLTVDGSLIGTGLRCDGKTLVRLPASASLAWAERGQFTWSAWFKPSSTKESSILYSRRSGAQAALVIGLEQGTPYVSVTDARGTRRSPAGAAVTQNQWQHLAVVSNGSTISVYLGGNVYATLDAVLPALGTAAALGGDSLPGASGFVGELDELEVSRVARNAGYIKFTAMQQGGDSAVLTLGETEGTGGKAESGAHAGYLTIILRSLTFDGWVVIVILCVMSAISWMVMVGKNSYVARIRKSNERFMEEFSHVAEDMTVLDNPDTHKVSSMGGRLNEADQKMIARSPLYRLYHIGAEEVRKRLSEDNGGERKAISAQAIKAIGASLDGGRVRETQRLNNQMVLLTIAISGGPFLGLLGTVIGVMITFAAVAAAGDVNVNAIAPGIAAALLATVAGLAVAIPALFGYNYLLTRIKDVSADMQVFVDEFITKVAESYPSQNR